MSPPLPSTRLELLIKETLGDQLHSVTLKCCICSLHLPATSYRKVRGGYAGDTMRFLLKSSNSLLTYKEVGWEGGGLKAANTPGRGRGAGRAVTIFIWQN